MKTKITCDQLEFSFLVYAIWEENELKSLLSNISKEHFKHAKPGIEVHNVQFNFGDNGDVSVEVQYLNEVGHSSEHLESEEYEFLVEEDHTPMTKDEFMRVMELLEEQQPDWRPGQRAFNCAALVVKELAPFAETLRGTDLDPYHHDKRIDPFIDSIFKQYEEEQQNNSQESDSDIYLPGNIFELPESEPGE